MLNGEQQKELVTELVNNYIIPKQLVDRIVCKIVFMDDTVKFLNGTIGMSQPERQAHFKTIMTIINNEDVRYGIIYLPDHTVTTFTVLDKVTYTYGTWSPVDNDLEKCVLRVYTPGDRDPEFYKNN